MCPKKKKKKVKQCSPRNNKEQRKQYNTCNHPYMNQNKLSSPKTIKNIYNII